MVVRGNRPLLTNIPEQPFSDEARAIRVTITPITHTEDQAQFRASNSAPPSLAAEPLSLRPIVVWLRIASCWPGPGWHGWFERMLVRSARLLGKAWWMLELNLDSC